MKVIGEVARRTDDSKLTDWYFGIDRWLLYRQCEYYPYTWAYALVSFFCKYVAVLYLGHRNIIRDQYV